MKMPPIEEVRAYVRCKFRERGETPPESDEEILRQWYSLRIEDHDREILEDLRDRL